MLDVQHNAILIKLSTLHIPRLTQTAMGGKMMAKMPRQMSLPHMIASVVDWIADVYDGLKVVVICLEANVVLASINVAAYVAELTTAVAG